MNGVFREYLDKLVIVFLDDIIIYSNTKEENGAKIFKRAQVVCQSN
jgi:hypothetical protein